MFPDDIHSLAKKVITVYARARQKLATAESCTGGLLAGALTDIPGASSVLERGYICYSNEAKIDMLGVQPDTLQTCGAVSDRTAEEMAQGALKFSKADVALSVTGIAGPDGGSPEKPVGLVCFGLTTRVGILMHYKCLFKGDRALIRMQSVAEGLKLALTVMP